MDIEGIQRETVTGAGCKLSVLTFGDETGQPLVLLHGMRDHAASLLFVHRYFPDCRVIAPDLRGHGDSDKPGVYGMLQYVSDLQAVYRHFSITRSWLIGHSLGGHIVTRFSSLYPDQVAGLAVLDGMGPPRSEPDDAGRLMHAMRWRDTINLQLQDTLPRKVVPDLETAVSRLRRNNPGLSPEQAHLLAEYGTEPTEQGLAWKWDPRIDMMWMTFSSDENEQAWCDIECPVLMVTGEHSLDYWMQMRGVEEINRPSLDAHYRDELQRRASLFRDARHIELRGAGHMLHYDQPDALGQILADFFHPLRG